MGSFPKAEQIVDDGAINRIIPASEPGALAPVRPVEAPNELWEWLRLLNRRKALIVGCGLVAVALMALIIAQATPMYKASARLLLDTRTFKVVSTEAALSGVDTMNLGAIQSELEVIQSEFLIGLRKRSHPTHSATSILATTPANDAWPPPWRHIRSSPASGPTPLTPRNTYAYATMLRTD